MIYMHTIGYIYDRRNANSLRWYSRLFKIWSHSILSTLPPDTSIHKPYNGWFIIFLHHKLGIFHLWYSCTSFANIAKNTTIASTQQTYPFCSAYILCFLGKTLHTLQRPVKCHLFSESSPDSFPKELLWIIQHMVDSTSTLSVSEFYKTSLREWMYLIGLIGKENLILLHADLSVQV